MRSSPSLAAVSTALLFAYSQQLVAALSDAQIASVFGTGDQLTGGQTSLPQFDFTVVTNATHALVSLNSSSPPGQVGWLATGTGTSMADADYLIAWPNPASASSPWTLSHRRPNGGGEAEQMPFPAAMPSSAQSTQNYYQFLPELSSDANSPFAAVTYLRRLQYASDYPVTVKYNSITRDRQPFIYASCSTPVNDADEAAQIAQHNQAHARTTLDLSRPITLAAAGGSGSSPSSSAAPGDATSVVGAATGDGDGEGSSVAANSTGRTKRDMYIIAHAVLGSLAMMIFIPLAVLIARFGRGFTWFPAHAGINLLGAAMIIACFGLGVYVSGDEHFDDTHKRVGLALLIIVVVQVLIGLVAHWRKTRPSAGARLPTLSGKGPIRLGHIVIGLATIALGWFQVHEGFEEWEEDSDAQTSVPNAVEIVFWIVLGLVAALYVLGWVLEAIGVRRQNRDREGGLLATKEKNPSYSSQSHSPS